MHRRTVCAGLVRTSLRPLGEATPVTTDAPPMVLNLACLATLYLRGLHWEHAIETYRLSLYRWMSDGLIFRSG